MQYNSSDVQKLNKFVEQHGVEGGDFFLGAEYSFAEVAATPFVQRASVALPQYRGYSVEGAIKEHNLTRLEAWIKVSCTSTCMQRHARKGKTTTTLTP